MGVKTISYGENVVALAYARERGAGEAIFANLAGNLCEGTGTNVFLAVGGRLVTPPLSSGCLAGVTRDLLLELLDVVEDDLPLSALASADEAFLSSSTREVQPISAVDGQACRARVDGGFAGTARIRFRDARPTGHRPVARRRRANPLGHPFRGLAGDDGDAVVVGVVVQDGRAVQLSGGGDDEVGQSEMAVLAGGRQHPMDVQGPVHGRAGHVDPALDVEGAPQHLVAGGVGRVVQILEGRHLTADQASLGQQARRSVPAPRGWRPCRT